MCCGATEALDLPAEVIGMLARHRRTLHYRHVRGKR
jgi:hypothetical protein